MTSDQKEFLLNICDIIHSAEELARAEREARLFGGEEFVRLLIKKENNVSVVIWKENTNHHEPHMHVSHSDKTDVSISLNTLEVLSGKIDKTTHKYLKNKIFPHQKKLLQIWNALNVDDDPVIAKKIITSFE